MVQAQPNPQQVKLPQRRWNVDEYHRIIAARILTPAITWSFWKDASLRWYRRNHPTPLTTSSLGNDFVLLFAGKAWVRQQLPIMITPDSEPEPDIAIVRLDRSRYRDRYPYPENIYLLIEVSDSTLSYEACKPPCGRDHKAKVYARASIPEYWLVTESSYP